MNALLMPQLLLTMQSWLFGDLYSVFSWCSCHHVIVCGRLMRVIVLSMLLLWLLWQHRQRNVPASPVNQRTPNPSLTLATLFLSTSTLREHFVCLWCSTTGSDFYGRKLIILSEFSYHRELTVLYVYRKTSNRSPQLLLEQVTLIVWIGALIPFSA